MLTSLVCGKIVSKLRDLPSAVMDAMSRKTDSTSSPLSNDLKKAVSNGKRISSILEKLPDKMFKKSWPDEVIRQLIDESWTMG